MPSLTRGTAPSKEPFWVSMRTQRVTTLTPQSPPTAPKSCQTQSVPEPRAREQHAYLQGLAGPCWASASARAQWWGCSQGCSQDRWAWRHLGRREQSLVCGADLVERRVRETPVRDTLVLLRPPHSFTFHSCFCVSEGFCFFLFLIKDLMKSIWKEEQRNLNFTTLRPKLTYSIWVLQNVKRRAWSTITSSAKITWQESNFRPGSDCWGMRSHHFKKKL